MSSSLSSSSSSSSRDGVEEVGVKAERDDTFLLDEGTLPQSLESGLTTQEIWQDPIPNPIPDPIPNPNPGPDPALGAPALLPGPTPDPLRLAAPAWAAQAYRGGVPVWPWHPALLRPGAEVPLVTPHTPLLHPAWPEFFTAGWAFRRVIAAGYRQGGGVPGWGGMGDEWPRDRFQWRQEVGTGAWAWVFVGPAPLHS